MQSDAQLLDAVPEFIQIGTLMKARPSEEAGRRFIFLEASNEDVDHAHEITLQKALVDSAEYFLRHGNIDISHYTLLGAKSGLSNFLDFEVGRPVDVRVSGKSTMVKAELYQGESPQARNALMIWQTMTQQSPPSRWYPSVGGQVLHKSMRFDPSLRQNVAVIDAVRWNNIALDRTPVNKTVGSASAVPTGVFAKSMGGALVLKTLTAGYATDSAQMTGGRALSVQSLDGAVKTDYGWFRDALASAISAGLVPNHQPPTLRAYAVEKLGVDKGMAAGLVRRFMTDLRSLWKG